MMRWNWKQILFLALARKDSYSCIRERKSGKFCEAETLTIPSLQTVAVTSFIVHIAGNTNNRTRKSLDCSRRNFVALKRCVYEIKNTVVMTIFPRSSCSAANDQRNERLEAVDVVPWQKNLKVLKEAEKTKSTTCGF